MTAKKILIIILSFILFFSTTLAVAKSISRSRPASPDDWLREIDKTIERLIATNESLIKSNEESSQEMKEMTSKILRYTEWLVKLTIMLGILTALQIVLLIKEHLYRKRQNTISKNEEKAYPRL